ncbi:MAG: helix-turn-helix domain-containing protein [Acidobacteriota bacterium]|nr:helix-turn-helix domain-containing protein [Acidobacteriota bacterium]MDQ5871196.1 helix-turn-helix domain-containing protein [Acidobacteriota bacterium]
MSEEAEEEIGRFWRLDANVGEALEACIRMLRRDANELEGVDGFSIRRVIGLYRRGIRISRVKYERYIPGLRILFFSIPLKACIYVTGVHARADLGVWTRVRLLASRFCESSAVLGNKEAFVLKTTDGPVTRLEGRGIADATGSPAELTLKPSGSLLAQEIRAAIQHQYLIAAKRGEISKIRAWRVVRGLDQAELASRAGMTQPEISRAERPGQVGRMKGETLRRVAQALQIRIDDLF